MPGRQEDERQSPPGAASPAVAHERLAAALAELTRRVREPDVRAQLSALGAVLDNLEVPVVSAEERRPLENAIAAACEMDDEPMLIAAMRRLAALDRSVLAPVDWSAVTRG
jgi:hypothetical protein